MSNDFAECASLFRCAQMASWLAESLVGKARDDAYTIKRVILCDLWQRFPHLLEVASDPQRPWDMGFTLPGVGGLHIPKQYLRTLSRPRAA